MKFLKLFLLTFILIASCSQAPKDKPLPSQKMRGLYLPNHMARKIEIVDSLIQQGKPLGINAMLLDAQTYAGRTAKLEPQIVPLLKKNNIYAISRVVCFQDGLMRLPLPEDRRRQLYELVETVAKAGYDEVQLDYIRFADGGVGFSLQKKYDFIETLLSDMSAIAQKQKVRLSADIFGRIVYNRKDAIGQNLELFSKHTDVIYPMLYPSHFTGDRKRMSDPGGTLLEGIGKATTRLNAINSSTKIAPFVQAFGYNIGYARVSLPQYVVLQIEAIESSEAIGWVAWNAKGDYSSVFQALQQLNKPLALQE